MKIKAGCVLVALLLLVVGIFQIHSMVSDHKSGSCQLASSQPVPGAAAESDAAVSDVLCQGGSDSANR